MPKPISVPFPLAGGLVDETGNCFFLATVYRALLPLTFLPASLTLLLST
jgi:hypothetical protein